MQNLGWALKAPVLIGALLSLGISLYCFLRSCTVLRRAHEISQGPLMRLTVWVAGRMRGEEAGKRRQEQLQKPFAIADWACRVAFVGGALQAAGVGLFVDVVSPGTYFPSALTWSTALRRAIDWVLPEWVAAYLFWRLGRSMGRKVASVEPGDAQKKSPSHGRTGSMASAFCFLTGANLMDGLLKVLEWIAFAIAKLGIV